MKVIKHKDYWTSWHFELEKKLLMCRKKNSLLLNRIVYVYRGLRQLDNARDYIKHIVFRKTVQLLYPVPSTNRMYAV